MMNRNSRSKEEVGGIIKSILVAEKKSSTIGMPIVQLEEEYRSQDGMRIPYRALGYGCLLEFLESLQRKGDIVVGKRGSMHVVYPCVDEKIAHVSALVSGQKDSIKRCSRGGRRNTSRSYPRVPYQPPRLTSNTLTDVLKVIKRAHNGMHVSKIIEYLHDRNIFTVEENHLIRQLRDVSHEVSIENSMIYPIVKQENNLQNFPPTNVNNTNGYAAEKNPAPAYKPAGFSDAEDDDMTFEFVKKSESVQSVPPENSNQLENEKSKAATLNIDENENAAGREEENCPANDNDDIGMLVNSRTRFRLEKLIQKHPNGIWCAELPKFYHQEYCIPLNYEDLGFGNVSDFAAHLPEIFHCVRLQDKGDFKLFDAKSPKPETRTSPRPGHLTLAALHNIYESYHDEVEPVPVLLSPTTSQRLVPEGVMTVGETVGQICVTQLFCDNTPHIDVIVVDAVTPTFFWIQLLRKTQKFGQFMRVLHEFYSENASKYVIPIVLLERGLNCACIYDKKWHRGVIKTVHPNSSVTVMFYDYGTVLTYPPQDIHFLHRSFSSLPAQAIPCGLYNLKPKSTEKWPYRVCQVFSEQVLDVPMVAMLGSIDADNNSMLIALTNTEGTVDFHISDWMISSGFAVYGRMVCIRPPNYPFRHYLECKHGKIVSKRDIKKTTSNSGKIVNCVENNGAPEISLANETSFYEALLKLRRKPGKNSLEAFSNSSSDESRSRRKESRVFDAATLQPVVKTSRIVVTQNNTTNKSIVSPNLDQPIGSQNENYGTNFLNKLCVSHANQIAAMNISNSSSDSVFNIIKPSDGPKSAASSSSCSVILPVCKNEKSDINRVDESQKNLEIPLIPKRFAKIANSSGGIFDVIKPSNRLESGASSTSVSVILPGSKNENLEMNRVDEKSQRNPEIPLVPKRFAKLAKLVASSGFKPLNPSTNSNDISSDEQNPPKPLHLRPEIPERQNCDSEFGAIYSTFGGHGSMEPIDWNRLRNAEKSAVPDHSDDAFKENPACIDSTTELEKHWKATHSSAFEKFEKFDKLEKLKKFEELERSEELKKFEELERSEDLKKLEELEKFDKLKQLEKLRKFEELEKSEKLKKLEKTILPRNVVKTQFENSDAPTRATSRVRGTTTNPEKHVSTKINQETAQPVNKITKNYQEIENCEEKSLPSYHKDLPKSRETYSLERYLKMSVFEEKASKPREWNVPRTEKNSIEHQPEVENLKASEESSHHHHHHQRRRELTKQAEKISIERHEEIRNSEKIFSKSDAKVSPTITTSVAKNSPSTNATSKLPPKKAAFLNFVRKSIEKKETLPEFGDFHSNIGGNGRMENIAWNELRKFDAPEKIVPPKKVATKSEKKTPVKLKSVKKGFSNIINRDLPPSSQRDSLCVPEGNIKRQAELSPTLRIILKSVNENREDKQLRLFIPDDIAELLKNDDSSSISSSSTYSQTDKTSAEDSREISGGCGIKSTVKYTSLRGDSTKRCSSSDTIPKSTGSESSRANDHSSRDFDSTNDVSAIMSGNANKSGEKLLKSSDTSAIASPASPAVARDTPRDVDASELIAVKEKSRSPKAEKIGKESVRKRVDFGVESRLIENLKKVGTSAEICSKSTDFTPIFRSERLTTHREDKRDTNRDAHSELVEGKEKLESPKAEKIGKENVRKRVDFSVESRLIKSLKNIGTSVEIRSNTTDFTPVVRSERLAISHREDNRDTNGGGHSELIEGEEKSRSQKVEKMGTENVRKRVDFRVASRLIENLDNVGSSTEILAKSTDFMIHDSDAHSELTEGGEKARKTRIDKIVRENEEKRIHTERVSACRFINFFPFRESRSNDRLETDVASSIADNGKLLDSDDLSSDEESNKQYSTRINHKSVNREQVSRTSLDSGDEQFSLPFDSSTKTLNVAIADILEKETRDSIGRADENSKETVNCEDFGKAEKSLCLPRNTERSSVQLAKDDSEFAPYYDDTCVVSDDEEWDFSAGVDLPVQDIDNRRQLINRRTCERIDEAPELEKTLTLKDSHSDNESTKDSRTDQQNEELNVTAYVISNIHQVSTENNENVGGDKSRSISIIEKLENNPNGAKNKETSTDSTQTSYSILSEVQKFNISATTEFLTRINSSSSSSSDGSSKDKSYTSSLMSALKQYLK